MFCFRNSGCSCECVNMRSEKGAQAKQAHFLLLPSSPTCRIFSFCSFRICYWCCHRYWLGMPRAFVGNIGSTGLTNLWPCWQNLTKFDFGTMLLDSHSKFKFCKKNNYTLILRHFERKHTHVWRLIVVNLLFFSTGGLWNCPPPSHLLTCPY